MDDKNKKIVFSEYYNSLPEDSKRRLRDTFLEKTGLTLPSFYYKMRFNSFKKPEVIILSQLIGCKANNIYLNK